MPRARRPTPLKAPDMWLAPVYRTMVVKDRTDIYVPSVACASDIYVGFCAYFRQLPVEEFWIGVCDVKNHINATSMISRGIADASLVHPREVFALPITLHAATIVLMHNHPSGDPEPSNEDRTLTARMVESGAVLGIPVLDHVVFGSKGYVSFAERGWLK